MDPAREAWMSAAGSAPVKPAILVLDDEPAMRMALTAILQRAGFEVIAAGSGKEALDALALHNDRVALLVVDMKLPDMFGREFVHHARARFGEHPILYLSGVDQPGRTDNLRSRHNFIAKPFDAVELVQRIRDLIAEYNASSPGDGGVTQS